MAQWDTTPQYSPNAPVEPNWAEKSGILSFLVSAIDKTKKDYDTEAKMKAAQQQQDAKMAQVQEQVAGQQESVRIANQGQIEQDYFKSLSDSLAQATDPGKILAIQNQMRTFAVEKGLIAPIDPAIKARAEKMESEMQKAESTGDWSYFADADEKQMRALLEERYAGDIAQAHTRFNQWQDHKAGKVKTPQPPRPVMPPVAADPTSALYRGGQAVGPYLPAMSDMARYAIPGMNMITPPMQGSPTARAQEWMTGTALPYVAKNLYRGISQFGAGTANQPAGLPPVTKIPSPGE